jgi:polar amino acid transport system substrate-binding protein
MGRSNRIGIAAVLVAVLLALLTATGCTKAAETKIEPKVTPPAIKEAGVLKVGVDLSYPPFAGTDSGKQVGLDIDAASALAEQLGLTLSLVDVKPSDAATALAAGKVDVVFSVPFSEAGLANTSLAGSYVTDAPSFFMGTDSTASVVPSLSIETLGAQQIAVQEGSASYWKLASEVGTEALVVFPTLREAITAAETREVELAAGDALVAGYIIRDFPTVHLAGQLEPAVPLGVGVLPDNTELSTAVRGALDALAADRVLETIRRKWVGGLPKLKAAPSVDASATP